MKLLIDGDIIAYQSAIAVENPIHWGDGLWTLHAYEDDVRSKVTQEIERLVSLTDSTDVVITLSDKNNFRKTVFPAYKANRTKIRKPMLLGFAKDFLAGKYKTEIWKNLEADDVLGIMGSESEDYLIWTLDKDLQTVPAKHWIDNEVKVITKEQADYTFLCQTLTGDLTDNYSGCPKIGPKTAEKLLAKETSWLTVLNAYLKAGMTQEDALTQARMARILRAGEYCKTTGDVHLWSPQLTMEKTG